MRRECVGVRYFVFMYFGVIIEFLIKINPQNKMEKIKEYFLVHGIGSDEFNRLVNKKIQEGWQPFGSSSSIFVTLKKDGLTVNAIQFNQSMIK